jgi:hypothetical protein
MDLRLLDICVPTARRFVTAALRGWEVPELVDNAVIVASELVTNALQATRRLPPAAAAEPAATLHLYMVAASLFIAVQDRVEALPHPVAASDDQEHGRGLMLVRMLATRVGHQSFAPGLGKVVWAELV